MEAYLAESVERVIKEMLRQAMFHPRESGFMARYALASRRAAALRREAAQRGEHVPPFLIASITSSCNLHCAGCYARALHACSDEPAADQLTAEEWARVFRQAADMGVSFVLLAGGEPLLRTDVLKKAAAFSELLFPIFTNGTLFTKELIGLFDRRRNLVPMLSLEGSEAVTDARRGTGQYRRVRAAMRHMQARAIAFGVSLTVTQNNLEEVTDSAFVSQLAEAGCKAMIFVEYVPADETLEKPTLDDAGRRRLAERLEACRKMDKAPLLLSFPGDEARFGGCLAAGRGFFHINAQGGAEPCPFSPYSDVNVRTHTLREVMNSALFRALREQGLLTAPHEGGCVLYEHRREVEALLGRLQAG